MVADIEERQLLWALSLLLFQWQWSRKQEQHALMRQPAIHFQRTQDVNREWREAL